jgi:hypothetical protein
MSYEDTVPFITDKANPNPCHGCLAFLGMGPALI